MIHINFSICIVSPPTTMNANEAPCNKKRSNCLIVGTTISINVSHLFILYILLCFSYVLNKSYPLSIQEFTEELLDFEVGFTIKFLVIIAIKLKYYIFPSTLEWNMQAHCRKK